MCRLFLTPLKNLCAKLLQFYNKSYAIAGLFQTEEKMAQRRNGSMAQRHSGSWAQRLKGR
jgi:hypothetical protein